MNGILIHIHGVWIPWNPPKLWDLWVSKNQTWRPGPLCPSPNRCDRETPRVAPLNPVTIVTMEYYGFTMDLLWNTMEYYGILWTPWAPNHSRLPNGSNLLDSAFYQHCVGKFAGTPLEDEKTWIDALGCTFSHLRRACTALQRTYLVRPWVPLAQLSSKRMLGYGFINWFVWKWGRSWKNRPGDFNTFWRVL